MRELFAGLNDGSGQGYSPRAVLKAGLPFIVAGSDLVRAEAFELQRRQIPSLTVDERRDVHDALINLLKDDSHSGLIRQPADIKIEVLRFIAETAPAFKEADNSADYNYTVSYLFDQDADVRKATAKMHADILTANKGDTAEETAYLKALLSRLKRVDKTGEPSPNEKIRLARVVEAANIVFPALSEEGKKQIITALSAIEWRFTSQQYGDLAAILDPAAGARLTFDAEGRVALARVAFQKFITPTPIDLGDTESPGESEGESLAQTLMNLSPSDIFKYAQGTANNVFAKIKDRPVTSAVVAGGTVLAGGAIMALVFYKILPWVRSEKWRTRILSLPGGSHVMSLLDSYLPTDISPAMWARAAITRVPYGAQVLGLVTTYVPGAAKWFTPDLPAAAESAIAPLFPGREQLEAAVTQAFDETPAVPVVEAKPDADDNGGGDGDDSPPPPEVLAVEEAPASVVVKPTEPVATPADLSTVTVAATNAATPLVEGSQS